MPERTSDGNTNVRINGINYYRSIGNLGDKSVGQTLTSISGDRLTEFVATADRPEFRITSIESVSAHNLELIDLTNISTLSGSLNLSVTKRLKTLKLQGTSLASIIFPDTDTLTNVELPKTLTSLNISKQPNLASVKFEGTENLSTIRIDHSEAKSFNSQGLIENLYSKYVNTGARPNSITILDADWNELSIGVLTWLMDEIPEIRITGRISIKEPSQTTSNINFDIKNRINAKFGNVDSDDSSLRIIYNVIPLTGITLQGSWDFGPEYPKTESTAQFSELPSSARANNHTSIVYEMTEEPQFSVASIDPITGLLTATNLSASEDYATIKAIAYTLDGSFDSSKRVPIWSREAQVGDVVYHDGTYSSVEDLDEKKTCVGVCFYIAPRNDDGSIAATYFNERDVQQRLMVSIEDISVPINATQESTVAVGPTKSKDTTNGIYDGSSYLTSKHVVDIYDVSGTSSLPNTGLSGSLSTSCREGTYESLRYNQGFKIVDSSQAFGDGFGFNETEDYVENRTLNNDLALLAGERYANGDVVNGAYINTLRFILQRNTLLRNDIYGEDKSIPLISAGEITIPSSIKGERELKSVGDTMQELRDWAKTKYGDSNATKWSSLSYPLASACYAYEPQLKQGQIIKSDFKSHNWFAPSFGHLVRICWYCLYGKSQGEYALNSAIDKGIMAPLSKDCWTITKHSYGAYWQVNASNLTSGAINVLSIAKKCRPITSF